MLAYPSAIDLSSSALRFLARQLAVHPQRIGSRWRRLTPGRQALLALAHLRCDTYTRLATGFARLDARPDRRPHPRHSRRTDQQGWRLLRKPRCGTTRITDIVKAVLVLHHAST